MEDALETRFTTNIYFLVHVIRKRWRIIKGDYKTTSIESIFYYRGSF